MQLTRLEKKDEREYREFIGSLEESLLYYSLSYKDFLEALLGCRPEYWIAREGGKITGALPVMQMEGPFGRILNSLPFYGSHGAVLYSSDTARDALYAKFNALAQAPGVAAATLIAHPMLSSVEDPVQHDLQDERIGQFTRLPSGENLEEQILGKLDASARRNIRKAKNSGITVSVENDAVEFLKRVHTENMRDIGGKAKTPGFFQAFPKYFEPDRDYKIYVAHRDGEPVSALLLFYFNRTVEYFVPVTVSQHRIVQPMAAILLRAMLDACRSGFTWWNWGGTWTDQEGVYRFKRKWGAEDYRYRYYVKINDQTILDRSEEALLEAYLDFFVVPFSHLNTACL